jgi:GNAT superfamily N-acetyltransferase
MATDIDATHPTPTQPGATQASPIQTSWVILDAEHPTLDAAQERFYETLRAERRYFGPSAATNPKPFPSLIDALSRRDGIRLAAVEQGRLVGLARVAIDGELFIAIVDDRRGSGVGTALGRAALERAADCGYRRIVMRSTQRSRAARRVGELLGCTVVEHGRGRTDMVLYPAAGHRRSA